MRGPGRGKGEDMEPEKEKTPVGELPSQKERVPIIQVRNLYKIYQVGTNKVHALDGVDFTMYQGEFCAIVGPSGSGKSTLLNMLAGLEKPSKGEIVIAGKHIERMNENQLVGFRRENVGFIFQSYNLLQTLNAVENVALPLSFRGVPKRIRNQRAKKFLKLVGLEKQMKHMANAMSGGQQQRVGIARALVLNPKIIFADEPTGNLDTKTTKEVLALMQRIVREQNQTLVMVTHDNFIAGFADRQFRIVDGKIVKIVEREEKELQERGSQEQGSQEQELQERDARTQAVQEQEDGTPESGDGGSRQAAPPADTEPDMRRS